MVAIDDKYFGFDDTTLNRVQKKKEPRGLKVRFTDEEDGNGGEEHMYIAEAIKEEEDFGSEVPNRINRVSYHSA